MNRERVASLALVAVCVFAVGVSATTLESSLDTDPDDVIDVDFRKLPIGGGSTVASVEKEIKRNGAGASERAKEAGGSAAKERVERITSGAEQRVRAVVRGPGGPWFRDLLWPLLVLGVLVTAATLVHRYRDRLLFLDRGWTRADDGEPWPPVAPRTDLERAWVTVVDRLDFDRPHSTTPRECETAAVDAGVDPEAVGTIVRTFEEVRYGGAPLTPERRRRVKEGLRRVESGSGGDT